MAQNGREFDKGRAGLDLIEEVFHLVRKDPARFLSLYLIGTAPFVLGLLLYWGDMSRSARAHEFHATGALLLSALFLWMKTWHSFYMRELWCEVSGEKRPAFTPRRIARVAYRQALFQPFGLFILPVALVILYPFGRVYATFQNYSLLADLDESPSAAVASKASRLAALWPKQNLFLMWTLSPYFMITAATLFLVIIPVMEAASPEWTAMLAWIYSVLFLMLLIPLSPAGMVVAINIAAAILGLPMLARIFLGVDSVYAADPTLMMNSTFFAVVCALAYVLMDPMMKGAYVLRVFHGESLKNGADLRVRLRKLKAGAGATTIAAAALAALLCASFGYSLSARAGQGDPPAADPAIENAAAMDSAGDGAGLPDTADDPGAKPDNAGQGITVFGKDASVKPDELSRALDEELKSRRYAWRMPREERPDSDMSWIGKIFDGIGNRIDEWGKSLGRWIRKIVDWFRSDREPKDRGGGFDPNSLGAILRIAMFAMLAVLLSVAGVYVYRLWKSGKAKPGVVEAEAVAAEPDLEDEATTADALPEDGWLELARDLSNRGEHRLALRALFLATLANLARRRLLNIARFKSNRDYERELRRHAHAEPEMLDLFAASVHVFEAVWYGTRQAGSEEMGRVAENQERMSRLGGQ